MITEILFYTTPNGVKSVIYESQYLLILLSKGVCWKL